MIVVDNSNRLDPDAIRQALRDRQFDKLKGTFEDDQFDAKSQPYFADIDASKKNEQGLKLAKDLTAFANHKGGVIVLGLSTRKLADQAYDVVDGVTAFDRALFVERDYRHVIENHTHPMVEVDIQMYVVDGTDAQVVAAIFVEKAKDSARPHIVKNFSVKGVISGHSVGIFERSGDGTSHYGPERIHSLLQNGASQKPLEDRLDALMNLVESLECAKSSPPAQPLADVRPRVEIAVSEAKLSEEPTFVLTARGREFAELPGLFRSPDDPTVRLVRNAPGRRQGEFGLPRDPDGTRLESIKGKRKQIVVYAMTVDHGMTGYKGLFVWRDGLVVFTAVADSGFLCRSDSSSSLINPLVLAESTFLFCLFVEELFKLASPVPTQIDYSLSIDRARSNDGPLKLMPGRLMPSPSYMLPELVKDAPEDAETFNLTELQVVSPERASYELRKALYLWFGFDEAGIPYRREAQDGVYTDLSDI